MTSVVGAAAIGLSLWWWTGHGVEWAVVDERAFRTQPWRAFTSIFPHVGPLHLIFNLYWFWVLGSMLERTLGARKYAGIIALLALISGAAEYAVAGAGVGLSGVGYGFFTLLWTLEQRDARFEGAVDENTIGVFVVWFFVCIGLTVAGVMAVGNVAHGAGAVVGWLLGRAVAPRIHERFEPSGLPRGMWWGAIVVVAAGSVLGAALGRTLLSPSRRADELAAKGLIELQNRRNDEAARLLAKAGALKPEDRAIWHNLGVAYERMGLHHLALPALRNEWGVSPDHPSELARLLAWVCVQEADKEAGNKRWDEAAALYHESLGYDGSDAAVWGRLGAVRAMAGDSAGAIRALETAVGLDPSDDAARRALEKLRAADPRSGEK